jgi:hypothetical protein
MAILAERINVLNALEVFTATASTGWVDLAADAKALILGSDFAASMNASIEADRDAVATVLQPGNMSRGLDPFFLDAAQQTGSVKLDPSERFRDLFDYMHNNALLVNSSEFSFGSPAAGGANVGDGTMRRLTVDDRGYTMEGWFADAFSATCDADANQNGVEYTEQFAVEGTNSAIDDLQRSGTGLSERMTCLSELDAAAYVLNPGFESYSGTTPTTGSPTTPTAVTGWTPASGVLTNLRVQVDQLYRTPPGSSTSISLEFVNNETLAQNLLDENGTTFDADVPVDVGVAVYRKASCDGQLTITLGATSRSVDLTTLDDDAWTWIWLRSTPDKECWYENFKSNDLALSYQLASRTTGSMVLDAGVCGPFALLGGNGSQGRGAMGSYLSVHAGQTPFLAEDVFTWTDTVGTRAKNQWALAAADLGYLPATGAGYEQILDAS